jgi:hypothetical protein
MHGGFAELRHYLPMDVSRDHRDKNRAAKVQGQVDRIQAIWSDCRKRHGGEGRSCSGASPSPTACSRRSHPLPHLWRGPGARERAYVDTIMKLPAMQEWVAGAKREPWEITYPAWNEP